MEGREHCSTYGIIMVLCIVFGEKELGHEPANSSRRRFLKKAALATAGTALLAGGYASLWVPDHLEITRFTLSLSRLPTAFDGIRFVHFSDVHLGFHMDEQDLRELADRIAGLEPDLLCFTGDIVDDYAISMKAAVPVMASMHATLGKFSILGNHDYRGLPAGVQELYPKTGFTLLSKNLASRPFNFSSSPVYAWSYIKKA